MLDALWLGLYDVLPLSDHGTSAFLAMLMGVAIGFVVGILPGLGGAVTLALMLPFTFTMDAVQAFAFLLGANAVVATTGDITSRRSFLGYREKVSAPPLSWMATLWPRMARRVALLVPLS